MNLAFNETKLNITIGIYNTSAGVYADAQDIVANASISSWTDLLFVRFTELVGQVGNWTLDKPSYVPSTVSANHKSLFVV